MKENKNMDANDGDDDDSPNFEALETSLDSLTGELYQVQLHHNSMKHALAEAREANKELKKDKSALEVELEDISDSLEEESACLGQLKAENKRLRDEAAKCANDADAVARETATNKKLNQENAALKIALETTKKEHDQEVSKQAQNLEDKRVAIHKFQQEIATLRSELEQLGKLHCRTTESFSVQTKLLQEQCKTLVSPEATSHEQKSPMGVDDGRKARRISL
ncbi:unnamed protein product [Cylindrotheca closterium]|uniref:Uncharacterized protein n=1 Tax=Cylindrotheca closterium TaxID=2856 RepID=A0AAD2FDG8_9STRA|nr:unnamed protein product [Cylindrotheca closterium]